MSMASTAGQVPKYRSEGGAGILCGGPLTVALPAQLCMYLCTYSGAEVPVHVD